MNKHRWSLLWLTVAALLLGKDISSHGLGNGIAYFAIDVFVLAMVFFVLFSRFIPDVKQAIHKFRTRKPINKEVVNAERREDPQGSRLHRHRPVESR